MAIPLSQADAPAAVERQNLLATFPTAGTDPVMQSIADVLDGAISDGHGGLPAIATDGSDDKKLVVGNRGVYFVHQTTLFTTQPAGSGWATFAHANYQGVYSQDSDVPLSTANRFYYNPRSHAFRFRDGHVAGYFYWRTMHTTDAGWPSNYIGHYNSRNAALAGAVRRGIATGANFTAFTGHLVETATRSSVDVATGVGRSWELMQGEISHLRQFRTEVTAINSVAASIQRTPRRYTLTPSLDQWDDDDDIEILLFSNRIPDRKAPGVRIQAGLVKGLVVNTEAVNTKFTSSQHGLANADDDKFIPAVIPQAAATENVTNYGHDRLWVGRVSMAQISLWAGRDSGPDNPGWNFVSINRLRY